MDAEIGRDEYRVTLFKKELRTILGADWIIFYNSTGRQHLCITRYQVGDKNVGIIPNILSMARIEHSIVRDQFGFYRDEPERLRPIDQIIIPIDQEALPERKRNFKSNKTS